MANSQPGILADVPAAGRYLFFRQRMGVDPRPALRALGDRRVDASLVVGFGPSLVAGLDATIDGLRELPALGGRGVTMPSTPTALFAWLRGDDRGVLLHEGRALAATLGAAFGLEQAIDAFRFREGRDLSGYVDGTENPVGARAAEVALLTDAGAGLDGSSFVAVQRWEHDLDTFATFATPAQDHIIGRAIDDNEEIDDAPATAHVKRTAQEDFAPEAFLVRRSMPFSDGNSQGLVFVAFGRSLDSFEAQVRRMVGLEDGVVDALFRFTQPVTGASFWCPPMCSDGERLDLSALGL